MDLIAEVVYKESVSPVAVAVIVLGEPFFHFLSPPPRPVSSEAGCVGQEGGGQGG